VAAEVQPDSTWAELEALDEAARQAAMRERFAGLVSADAGERDRQINGMIQAEYSLDDKRLHAFTVSRLRAWMTLAGENLEHAQVVAGAWDEAFKKVPGEMAMRRAGLVQTVARDEFNADDIDVLYELIPGLVGHLPRASQQALEHAAQAERMSAAEERASRKPWWKFW
jgi:hypothetical protein